MDQERAATGYVLADDDSGSELIFLPDEPDTLILLPRHFDESELASRSGLLSALAWFLEQACESEVPPEDPVYEPGLHG